MSNEVDDLVSQYKALDEQDELGRARIESEIWKRRTLDPRFLGKRREYLADLLGVNNVRREKSALLFAFGEDASPLWERVKLDMSVTTALNLMRTARDLSSEVQIDIAEAVRTVVAKYDGLPHVKKLGNGKIVKVSAISSKKLGQHLSETENDSTGDRDRGRFRADLRAVIGSYFSSRLRGFDPMIVEMSWKALEADISIALDFHTSKIFRLKREHASRQVTASRGKVIAAHRALRLEPPRPGGPIDLLVAKKQFRKLASLYHPDKSGTEDTRSAYEAVVEAYQILEEVHETQTGEG